MNRSPKAWAVVAVLSLLNSGQRGMTVGSIILAGHSVARKCGHLPLGGSTVRLGLLQLQIAGVIHVEPTSAPREHHSVSLNPQWRSLWDGLCAVECSVDVDSQEQTADLYAAQIDLFGKLVKLPPPKQGSPTVSRISAARAAIHSEYLDTLGEEIGVLGELLNMSKRVLDHDDLALKRELMADYFAVAACGDKLRTQTSVLDTRWRARNEALKCAIQASL